MNKKKQPGIFPHSGIKAKTRHNAAGESQVSLVYSSKNLKLTINNNIINNKIKFLSLHFPKYLHKHCWVYELTLE